MYLRLTDVETGTPVCVKDDAIKVFYKRQNENFTSVFLSASRNDMRLMVSESVEEIEKALNENVVWKPVEI